VSETKPSRGPFAGALLAGTLAACCLLGGAAVLLEDAYATSVLADQLAARGVECDERFAVDATPTLDAATIGPTTCTVAEGAVESFELLDPVTVELDAGLEPRHVRAGRVRVSVRFDPPVVTGTGLDAIMEALAVPQRLGLLVSGAAELARADLPRIDAASIEVERSGEGVAALAGVTISGGSPLEIEAERVDLPQISAPLGTRATIAIAPLTGTATPERVELEGDLDVDATLPVVGETHQEVHVRVAGEGLDSATPTFRIGS
jgi:hypothetical protein